MFWDSKIGLLSAGLQGNLSVSISTDFTDTEGLNPEPFQGPRSLSYAQIPILHINYDP